MKKTMLSTLLVSLALLGPEQASAGDIGLASSTYDWAGAYIGANAGGTVDAIRIERQSIYTGLIPITPADKALYDAAHDELDASNNGFTGGFMAGYNWQAEQVVFGIEADINALSLDGATQRNVSGVFRALFNDSDLVGRDRVTYQIDTFGTLRGRLGFAVDNVMLYGTGGLAYAHAKTEGNLYVQDATGAARWSSSESDWNLGWTIGAGLEYGIGRWSLGVEYLYADLLPVDWRSASGLDLASEWSMDYSFSVLRATGKVRF